MLRRILLASVVVAASTTMATPIANAGPATAQCATSGGVKVSASASPAAFSVIDTRTGDPVGVVVTITGSEFTIDEPTDAAYTLRGASWCVKSSLTKSDPSPGAGLTGSSASVNKKGTTQDIGYVVVYSVTTAAPLTDCFDGSENNADFRLTGPMNTRDNASGYSTFDGSCSGDFIGPATIVSASDQIAADALCVGIEEGTSTMFAMVTRWPTTPSTWWMCSI